MITITKKLDMSPHGIPQVIHVSQYDSDFSIQFKLYASVGTLSIESGTTAEIRGTKGSGTGYSASATLDTSNGTVTVAGSEQMTAVAGRNTFEIVLKKSGKVLGSANFILLVERAALDADTITDASVLRELNAIVEGAETATQAAEEAEDAADRAEAAAESLEIDDTLTQTGQAADAKKTGDKIAALKEDLSAITQNIWQWGDQEVTGLKTVTFNANIPAGTYTLSALVTKNESGNVRMMFYKDSVSTANQLANPYIAANSRNSKTFTLAEDCDIVQVYSAPNVSGTVPAVWSDIQIEAGSNATAFTPHITATDFVARNDIAKNKNDIENIENDIDNINARLERQELIKNTVYQGETSVTLTLPKYNTFSETPILACDAMFTREQGVIDYPKIRIEMKNDRNLIRQTTTYMIGKEDQYEVKEWRAPAYIWGDKDVTIVINVPLGCTLTIRSMKYRFDSSVNRNRRGVTFFARPGTCNMVPELSLPALQMAFRHGYDTFTIIPKVSSDGVWFTYHDDTWDVATTLMRNPDGTKITNIQYDGEPFHNIPFGYINQYRAGVYGSAFYDVHFMKLEDCFKFLAETGMKLRMSMHPYAGINTNLVHLRRLIEKYGLLKDTTVIVNDISTLFGTFGNDIGGYCFPNSVGATWDGVENRIDEALTKAQSAKVNYGITCPISCGMWADGLFSNLSNTEELVSDILDAGFSAGVFSYNYTGIDGQSHSYLFAEDIHKLMSLGVTEFTEGYNTSLGLNW